MDFNRVFRNVLGVAGATGLCAAVLAGGVLLPTQSAFAEPYWRCPSGWTFRVNAAGTGAQCRRRATDTVTPIICPNVTIITQTIGTVVSVRSGRDRCVGEVNVAGVINRTEHDPLPCQLGYDHVENREGNADRCVKRGVTEHQAPSARFESTP
jgi:hypothetical protein